MGWRLLVDEFYFLRIGVTSAGLINEGTVPEMSEGYSRRWKIALTKGERILLTSRWLRSMDRTRKWFGSYLSGRAHLIQLSQPSRSTLVFPRVLPLGPPTLLFLRRSHPGSPATFLNIFQFWFLLSTPLTTSVPN